MKELKLKYGCNPNQKQARIFSKDGELPIKILNGSAGYINLLDALNSWQLVKELKTATALAAAASFKHVSPAGAAVAVPLSKSLKKAYFIDDVNLSDIATAYFYIISLLFKSYPIHLFFLYFIWNIILIDLYY